jgi:flagellar capping protein FliD
MVNEIVKKAQEQAQPIVDKRDKLELKANLYEELVTSFRALQSTLTLLKLPATYNARKTEVTRTDKTGVASAVLTATATTEAPRGIFDIKVLKRAKTQTTYGTDLSGAAVGKDSVFYINVGGKRGKIDVKATDTVTDVARKINAAKDIQNPLVSLDVVASVENGALVIKSKNMGSGSDGKLTQKVTRTANSYDEIGFIPDLTSAIIDGTVIIKGKGQDGIDYGGTDSSSNPIAPYQLGVDFDVVGNRIVWREHYPKTALAGDS